MHYLPARLAVRAEAAIGAILECPKCDSMVHITPPEGWKPVPPPGDEPLPDLPPGLPPLAPRGRLRDTGIGAGPEFAFGKVAATEVACLGRHAAGRAHDAGRAPVGLRLPTRTDAGRVRDRKPRRGGLCGRPLIRLRIPRYQRRTLDGAARPNRHRAAVACGGGSQGRQSEHQAC